MVFRVVCIVSIVCFICRIRSWAEKLGVELWHAGDYITRRKSVQDVSRRHTHIHSSMAIIVSDTQIFPEPALSYP